MSYQVRHHEVTLVAFKQDETGRYVIEDIVETDWKCARKFARRFYRDPKIVEFAAVRPGTPITRWRMLARTIYRAADPTGGYPVSLIPNLRG